jgi:hypothetical protein
MDDLRSAVQSVNSRQGLRDGIANLNQTLLGFASGLGPVQALAMSPDGKWLVPASPGVTVRNLRPEK